jgi:hypothetical protein
MTGFADALAAQTMPKSLGDVQLRIDSPLLIGEAQKPPLHLLRQISFWSLGVVGTGAALGSVVLGAATPLAMTLTLLAVGFFAVAILLDRHAHRRRAFVIDFNEKTLRLDFSTPLTGMARTWVGRFEQVKALGLLTLPNGQAVLTIDIDAPKPFREVLVAALPPSQLEAVQALERLLINAFGLKAVVQRAPSVAEDLGTPGAE